MSDLRVESDSVETRNGSGSNRDQDRDLFQAAIDEAIVKNQAIVSSEELNPTVRNDPNSQPIPLTSDPTTPPPPPLIPGPVSPQTFFGAVYGHIPSSDQGDFFPEGNDNVQPFSNDVTTVIDGPNGDDRIYIPGATEGGSVNARGIRTFKTFVQSNEQERAELEAQASNWFTRLGERLRDEVAKGVRSVESATAHIGNEVYRWVGGNELSQHMTELRNSLQEKLKNGGELAKEQLDTLLGSALEGGNGVGDLSGDLLKSLQNQDVGLSLGGAATLSLQAGLTGDFVINGVPVKAGGRISLTLGQAAGRVVDLKDNSTSYHIGKDGQYRMTVTGIIGTRKYLGASVDIEMNLGLSIQDGKVRIDGFSLDPVMDWDMRGKIYEWTNKAFGGKLKTPGQAYIELQPLGAPAQRFADRLNAGFGDGTVTNPKAKGVVRNYSIVEGSPLRFAVLNTDTAPEQKEFRGGWQGNAAFGYMPGIKVIEGVGFAMESGPAKGFVRTIVLTEVSFGVGTKSFSLVQGYRV